jgi:pSer/pThr/pTyr-binding forkhead associated (FHA) protein
MTQIRVQVGVKGSAKRIENVFKKHEITIGRDSTNDVILKRTTVSKVHCRAIFINGVLMVGDSGSTNGTYVNDSRVIGWMPVRSSDEVHVGEYVVSFSAISEPKKNTSNSGEHKEKKERTSTGTGRARQKQHKTRNQKKANAPPATPPKQDQTKTPWEVLGIPKGASKADARKAYLKLLAMYHPDKVDSLGHRLKEIALEVTRELNEAWEKIESGKA